MIKFFIKIMLLLAIPLLFLACQGKNTPSQPGGFFSLDETEEAEKLVREANERLKLIKQRFADNEERREDLVAAMKGQDAEKVRSIANEFVTQINDGTEVGNEAISKLRSAREKNINEDFKEYLSLKIQALEKYVEAFEERRQVAISLREKFDPKNDVQRKIWLDELASREGKFWAIIYEAREASDQANKLARDSVNRKK